MIKKWSFALQKWQIYAVLVLTFCIWGSLYVVSKYVLGQIPAFTTAELRAVIAVLAIFLILRNQSLLKVRKEDYKEIFLLGFLGYFFSLDMQLLGTQLSSASLASLLNALNPIVIMLLAASFLGEKLTKRKIIGILLSLAGVYVILGDAAAGTGSDIFWGVIFSLLSVLSWGIFTIRLRKIAQRYAGIVILFWGMLVGAVCNLPAVGWEFVRYGVPVFSLSGVVALLYMGLICTGLAHFFWNYCLGHLEAGNCALFYPLQPLMAALMGIFFLGETLTANFLLGSVFILGGLLLELLGKEHRG